MKTTPVPQIEISTTEGKFGLRVARSNLVELSGVLDNLPFCLTLKKKGDAWECEGASPKILDAFSQWAETHPRLFEMAERLGEHNANAELLNDCKKNSASTR